MKDASNATHPILATTSLAAHSLFHSPHTKAFPPPHFGRVDVFGCSPGRRSDPPRNSTQSSPHSIPCMLRVLVRVRTVGLLASPVAPFARRTLASMAASASDTTSTAPEATTSDSPTGCVRSPSLASDRVDRWGADGGGGCVGCVASRLDDDVASSAPRRTRRASARRVRIYTRTGDKGSSSLYNGKRRPKDDAVFDALGDVDELNATLGVAREHALLAGVAVTDQLLEIQSRLMDVGTAVATPLDSSSGDRLATAAFDGAHATQLERWIDELDAHVPPLRNFILPVRVGSGPASRCGVSLSVQNRGWSRVLCPRPPQLLRFDSFAPSPFLQGGGLTSAHLHHSRTVCRRAERSVVGLVRDGAVPSEVGIFLNRCVLGLT